MAKFTGEPPQPTQEPPMSTETPSSPEASKRRKVTTARLAEMKARGEKIAMLTAYDFSFARILDGAGIDVVLVGDSAANVVHGFETTVPITLDQMISHAASVVRGVKRALVVVDMPSVPTRATAACPRERGADHERVRRSRRETRGR